MKKSFFTDNLAKIGILSFFMGILFLQNQAQAVLFWTEDWEGTTAEVYSRWPNSSCPNPEQWPDAPLANFASPARTTTQAYTGTHSLQYHFMGIQPNFGGCSHGRGFGPADEIWMRWYEKWSVGLKTGGEIGQSGTKRPYMYSRNGSNGHYWHYQWGNKFLTFVCQNCGDAANGTFHTKSYLPNTSTPMTMVDNQWFCYEARLKYNTPGQKDGIYELYMQNMTTKGPNTQVANYQGLQWRGSLTTDPMPSTANWGSWKIYSQDGLGDIYEDGNAVGTTRIGCGGIIPGDNHPPTVGLQVPAAGAVNIDPVSGISFHLFDNTGVNPTSIKVQVMDSTVTPVLSIANPNDITVTYKPAKPFIPGSSVTIKVDAKDVLGNTMPQVLYSFRISSNTTILNSAEPSARGRVFLRQAQGRFAELIVNTAIEGLYELRVVDISGQGVGSLTPQMLHAGSNRVQIEFNKSWIGKGIYFVILKQGNKKDIFQLVKLH